MEPQTMKTLATIILAAASCCTAAASLESERVVSTMTANPFHGISAKSELGRSLLSQARRLADDDDDDADNGDNGGGGGYSWVEDYAIKFEGCHHHATLNLDANDEDDVRIKTVSLVRFRLCPADACSSWFGGCHSDYGEYVIDLPTFTQSYLQAKADGQKKDENNFQARNYVACSKWEGKGSGGDYYIGAYCPITGKTVNLGLFTDDTCTNFADPLYGTQTFKKMAGFDLPYSIASLVSADCVSCEATANDANDNGGDDDAAAAAAVAYGISEQCSSLYEGSGKCEQKLDYTESEPNNYACSYISGIMNTNPNGVVRTHNLTADFFIVMFAGGCLALGMWANKLRKTLVDGKAEPLLDIPADQEPNKSTSVTPKPNEGTYKVSITEQKAEESKPSAETKAAETTSTETKPAVTVDETPTNRDENLSPIPW